MDELTRLTVRVIALETAVEKLNKIIEEFQSAHTSLERLGILENRVEVLEAARQRQIVFNSSVITKTAPTVKSESTSKKSFWDWLK